MKRRKETVDSSQVREWHVRRALESAVALAGVINDLTQAEALYCLEIESRTTRRRSIISTLIRRAAKLQKKDYINHLKENYHGT